MLFTGTYPRTLDGKKRVSIPPRLWERFGRPKTLFLSPGADQSIWVYTEEALERLAEQLNRAPPGDPRALVFARLFFAQTEMVPVDANGRILILDRLLEFAGLKHEVVLIGVRDHFELWDAERWQKYLAQNAPQFDGVIEAAFRQTD
jgi:MraZ protein